MMNSEFLVTIIFTPQGDGRRGPQADDSHSRLFGSDRGFTPAKNRLKSNIPIGGDEADSSLKHTNGNGHTNSSREHIAGSDNGKSNYRREISFLIVG